MKKIALFSLLTLFCLKYVSGQEWMTSLEMAQRMALSNDKLVLMIWEESVFSPYPAIVKDENGQKLFIKNVFNDEGVSKLFWQYFVPVIVSDHRYAELYKDIKGKRSMKYIDKFNDDGFKVMDINGNIINTDPITSEYLDLNALVANYGLNTTFLQQQLLNYRNDKDFYSAFYLADQYLNYATAVSKRVIPEIIALSDIYLTEAKAMLETEPLDNKDILRQRCMLVELKQYLILGRPRKVLRDLERIEKEQGIFETNENLKAFLYYTSYFLLNDEENTNIWRSEVSLVDLKKVQAIINATVKQRS